jgi:hypothetical protein
MAQLFYIPLTKAHLAQIPFNERVFYFLASQLENDLNGLTKLLWFAFNEYRTTDGLIQSAALSQVMLIMKLLAGKLYEGHKLIAKMYSGKKLHQKYQTMLNNHGRAALQQINSYFGRNNIIKKIRNEFAFHFEAKDIAATFSKFADTELMPEYWGVSHAGHNLAFGAELLTVRTMQHVTGLPEDKALLAIFKETTEAATWFGAFIQNYTGVLMSNYIGITQDHVESAERISLPHMPSIDTVKLPYFCEPPSDYRAN